MLSSKELLEKAGISRATLNNYIALGMLDKPLVLNPGIGAAGPRQLGFFPDDASERIEQIQKLKKEGLTMTEIALRLGATAKQGTGDSEAVAKVFALPTKDLRVTIEDISYPAYMVNHNFELVWFNEPAKTGLLLNAGNLPPTGEGRSIFQALVGASAAGRFDELVRFNVALAKMRIAPGSFEVLCKGIDPPNFARLQDIYAEVSAVPPHPVVEAKVVLPDETGAVSRRHVYASSFREGIFIVLVPEDANDDSMLELLARRDEVIRGLLSRRLPVLTNLAVLVADLQGSVNICSELPPDEYFQLINEIWATLGLIFRKYHGTYGKHVGDGMVYYFFPEPDSDYLFNALCCAQEIRREMARISKDWQISKNWLNELYLNTGITEGQEWLGTFQSSTSVEFVVLGDTINQAARISDMARHGAIWATKSLLSKLPRELRNRVRYGIKRRSADGRELFVGSSFATVSSLIDPDNERAAKLRDIATLPITEIVEIAP